MMKPKTTVELFPLVVLLFALFACRPMVTVGWQEIGILVLLILVLAGPALFRLYRRFDEFQNWKANKGKKQPEE